MSRKFITSLSAVSLLILSGALLSTDRAVATDEIAPATEAAPVTVIGSRQAEGVLGKEVRSSADERIGRLVDIVVDRNGQVRAAVIDFGGFFGVGSRKIAVDWSTLKFDHGGERPDVVTLELKRDQIKDAPEYKDKCAVIVLRHASIQSSPE